MPARPLLALTAVVLAVSGCGNGGSSGAAGSSSKVAVKAGDSACEVAKSSFDTGTIAFDVTNVGKDTTEVYVYGKGSDGDFDKVVGEVENIAPGTSRDFTVEVSGGDYEVVCKPGQKGDGIRTTIRVSGTAATANATYDREVEFMASDYAFAGLTDLAVKTGEKIEFKLENTSEGLQHEFEVLGPDGKDIGEIGPTNPGADGEVILTFAQAGTYTFLCGISDHEGRGMKGTFTVS